MINYPPVSQLTLGRFEHPFGAVNVGIYWQWFRWVSTLRPKLG